MLPTATVLTALKPRLPVFSSAPCPRTILAGADSQAGFLLGEPGRIGISDGVQNVKHNSPESSVCDEGL